jgi:uncharacterized protein YuzE
VTRADSEITYERESDRARLRLAPAGPAETPAERIILSDERLPATIVVELDQRGRIAAFELINASRTLPLELIKDLR